MAECIKCGKKIPFLMGCFDDEDNDICRECWNKYHDIKLKKKEKGNKEKINKSKKRLSESQKINPSYWIKVGFYLAIVFFLFNFLVGFIIYLLFWGTILSFLK